VHNNKYGLAAGRCLDPLGELTALRGAYSTPPNHLAGFRGALLLREREGRRGRGGERGDEGWGHAPIGIFESLHLCP